MITTLRIPAEIRAAIDAGALFVISHSGGKDSQAMTALLRLVVPAERLVVVHADLPDVEWAGTLEHIQRTIGEIRLEVCQANYRDGAPKSFLDLVNDRGQFPLPKQRQCTSDLKRGPIEVVTRRLSRETGIKRIVSCIGIRAEESTERSRKAEVEVDKRLSKAGREVLTWHPILELTVEEVFAAIAEAGQVPHWAYAAGMSRLSCMFCILASRADLTRSAELNPEHYYEIRAKEAALGHTLSPSRRPLAEIVGLDPTGLVGRAIAAGEDLEELEAIDLVAMAIAGEDLEAPAPVLSYGAGVDSTAILAIHLFRDAAARILGLERAAIDAALPRLEAVVFADTGAESRATYRNVETARRLAAQAGLPFAVTFKRDKAGDHYRIQDHHLRLGTLPIMPGCGHVCSLKFKQEAIRAWRAETFGQREVLGLIGYDASETSRTSWAGRETEYVLGFEAGEGRRCAKAGRFNPEPGVAYRFPLVELGLDRAACEELLAALWPHPVAKSSCVFCPFMTEPEIRELYRTDPEGWQLVRDLESALRRESDRKHGRYLEAMAAHRADPETNPSPLNKAGRCKTGFWSKHTWNEGIRAFWGAKIGGRILSTDEWAERFDAELEEDLEAPAPPDPGIALLRGERLPDPQAELLAIPAFLDRRRRPNPEQGEPNHDRP